MIIDCHVHLNNYTEEKVLTEDNIRLLREHMDKWKLDHALVLTSYKVNPDRPSAADLLEKLEGDARIHLVEGVWVTGDEAVDWENVAKRLRKGHTKGLKFYPGYEHAYPGDKLFEPALELASKYKVPVMIHTGDTFAPHAKLKYAMPIHVDEVAVDYPDVNFVICHLGNPWLMDTAEIIYKNENVYADISGLVLEEFDKPLERYMREELADFLVYSGEPDKLLYGTDWPLVKMGPYLRFVRQLKLEPHVRDMLMWQNAARLFRIDVGKELAPHEPHAPMRGVPPPAKPAPKPNAAKPPPPKAPAKPTKPPPSSPSSKGRAS